MDFRIERDALLEGLQLTQGIIERRTTIPILANVLITGEKNQLCISATDHEVGLRFLCDADLGNPGALTTSARKIFEIIKQCPDGPIEMKVLDNYWVAVKSGKSRFKMVGSDPSEFPEMSIAKGKSSNEFQIEARVFREMIARTLFAVSNDETRLNLSGIFLEVPENGLLRFVATDGHRLSMISRKVEGATKLEGVIVPRKGIGEIFKAIDDDESPVSVSVEPGVLKISQSNTEIAVRLVEGEFPDYDQVIPKESTKHVTIGVDELLAALRRVSVVSSERTRGVKIEMSSNHVSLSSINPELGEANEDLDAEYRGDDFALGFNSKYVVDILSVLESGTVDLGFTDDDSPCLLRSEDDADFFYVVMPMKL